MYFWRYGQKTWQRPNLWCTRRNLCHSKEVLTCLFFTTQTRKITQTQTENTSFPSIFHPKKLHIAFHGVIFLGYSSHNNRSCRGLKNVQNALEFTTKLCYIVSQSFFMNLAMENPSSITVHLSLLMMNKLCTRHENNRPQTFSAGQISGRFVKAA